MWWYHPFKGLQDHDPYALRTCYITTSLLHGHVSSKSCSQNLLLWNHVAVAGREGLIDWHSLPSFYTAGDKEPRILQPHKLGWLVQQEDYPSIQPQCGKWVFLFVSTLNKKGIRPVKSEALLLHQHCGMLKCRWCTADVVVGTLEEWLC